RGINRHGQIAGFSVDSRDTAHGFLYGGGVYTTIDAPSAGHGQDPRGNRGTFATGINDAGQIVGYYRDDTFNLSQTHGFLYTTTPNPAPPAPTTADMILRHDADGLYEIYDIGNNSILTAYSLAQLGTDWQF